jgi:uncharacterized protein YdaU (DUF1376 family)
LGDYAKNTGHLSLAEHGAYRLLLDHYYATESQLPGDIEKLCRICRAQSKIERAAVASVINDFFYLSDGLYSHKRADRELAKALASREKNAKNGAKGGRPRQTQEKPTGFSVGSVSHNPEERLPNNQEPITNVLLEKEPKGAAPAAPGVVGSKESSLEQAKRLAIEANAEPFPLSLTPMPGFAAFQAAWNEWCDYRTERATVALKSERIPWTKRSSRNGLLEIERVAAGTGLGPITDRIREALGSSWRGLNLSTMKLSNGSNGKPASAPQQPPKPAYWQTQPPNGSPEWHELQDKKRAFYAARKQQQAGTIS